MQENIFFLFISKPRNLAKIGFRDSQGFVEFVSGHGLAARAAILSEIKPSSVFIKTRVAEPSLAVKTLTGGGDERCHHASKEIG